MKQIEQDGMLLGFFPPWKMEGGKTLEGSHTAMFNSISLSGDAEAPQEFLVTYNEFHDVHPLQASPLVKPQLKYRHVHGVLRQLLFLIHEPTIGPPPPNLVTGDTPAVWRPK